MKLDGSLERSKHISAWVAEQLGGLQITNLPHDKRLQLAQAVTKLQPEFQNALSHKI